MLCEICPKSVFLAFAVVRHRVEIVVHDGDPQAIETLSPAGILISYSPKSGSLVPIRQLYSFQIDRGCIAYQ